MSRRSPGRRLPEFLSPPRANLVLRAVLNGTENPQEIPVFIPSSLLALAGVAAHEVEAPAARPVLQFPDTVVTQILADGRVAGAGPDWKMIVGPDRATFVPVLGERAPRNLPIAFGIPTLTVGSSTLTGAPGEPRLDGVVASVDHGDFTSVYRFEPGFVEQSFVIDALPSRGEIAVRIPLHTELTAADVDPGLRFDIPGIGAIGYGDATIFDRAGRSVGARSELRDGAIEIRVPSGFVEVAEFPIVVDPAITPVLDVDENTSSFTNPEVAWDAVHDLYTVIFQRQNSATEADLFVNRVSGSTGAVLSIASVDLTSNNTVLPSIANSPGNQNYLCVWRKDPDGIFDDIEIRGAIVTTGGGATTSFTISTGSDNETHPDVGGSSSNGNYLVVWQENPALGGGGENVVARTVNSGSKALGPKIDVADTSADEIRPRVNKHSVDGKWTVVWETVTGAANSDIVCALFNGGTMTSTNNHVSFSSSFDDKEPHVAQMANGHFVFAWERRTDVGTSFDLDVMTRRYSTNAVSYAVQSEVINLSDLAATASEALDQDQVCVCANGDRVLYAFHQGSSARYLSANFDDETPVIIEKNLQVNTNTQEGRVRLAARGHVEGSFDQLLAVFADGGDILGQFFETTTTGGVTFLQTGCGGSAEPKITLTGSNNDPLICEPFTISTSGFTNGLLVIGLPTTLALCPNQGGCVLGASFLATAPIPNGVFTFTIPCDPALLTTSIALCGISTSTAAGAPTSCGPPKFSTFFRTSDTMVINFQ